MEGFHTIQEIQYNTGLPYRLQAWLDFFFYFSEKNIIFFSTGCVRTIFHGVRPRQILCCDGLGGFRLPPTYNRVCHFLFKTYFLETFAATAIIKWLVFVGVYWSRARSP